MKQKDRNKKQGQEAFYEYYQNIFGERWNSLKNALLQDNKHIALKIENCEPYFLDAASVFAAFQLPLDGAKTVLDMCAAPGGKTLVLASRMEEDATLFSNERSSARKQRLFQTCSACLPENIFNRVKISCSDGAVWCKTQSECYERILLDAPCSSERHVLNDKKYLDMWSENRVRSLAMEQWALLSSAYRLLTCGGILVYSTCALNPSENDKVIQRLLKKFPNSKIIFDIKNPCEDTRMSEILSEKINLNPEKTELGYHILPDTSGGSGPIWFCVIQKLPENKI